MAKTYGEAITTCPACGTSIGAEHLYTWCTECGNSFSRDTLMAIPSQAALLNGPDQASDENPRHRGNQSEGDTYPEEMGLLSLAWAIAICGVIACFAVITTFGEVRVSTYRAVANPVAYWYGFAALLSGAVWCFLILKFRRTLLNQAQIIKMLQDTPAK